MIKRGSTALGLLLMALVSAVFSMGAPGFDLWLELDYSVREAKRVGNSSACLDAITNIVEHLKNASFQQEVLAVLSNTGKMFNDIGYYQSCMQTGNLTYYLIRPLRTDLKTKFNFGV